jgi:hypothetical protein
MSESFASVQPTAGETPIEAVRALADELTKMVSVACALVEADRAVDLTGLDRDIGLLCAKSLDLPPDEGRTVRPRLIALLGSAEALMRALARHDAPPH